MKELKYLNKFFLKYRNKIIIGILITIIARIFALVAPNLVGDSITLIEKYFLENSINENFLKKTFNQYIFNHWICLCCRYIYFSYETNINQCIKIY